MADGKIFLFRFAVEGFVFQFDQQTIDRLSAFVERSNLSSMTVDDVYKSLAQYSSQTGLVQRSAFQEWLLARMPPRLPRVWARM